VVQQSHAGRSLAFTDDDVIVGRRWLTEILNEFDRDPVLGLVAGRVEPAEPVGPSVAVTRALQRTPLNDLPSLEGIVLGCNLAIRAGVLAKVKGETHVLAGRGLSCEDIDFTYASFVRVFRECSLRTPLSIMTQMSVTARGEYQRGLGCLLF